MKNFSQVLNGVKSFRSVLWGIYFLPYHQFETERISLDAVCFCSRDLVQSFLPSWRHVTSCAHGLQGGLRCLSKK